MSHSAKNVSLADEDWETLFKECGTTSPSEAVKILLNKLKKG